MRCLSRRQFGKAGCLIVTLPQLVAAGETDVSRPGSPNCFDFDGDEPPALHEFLRYRSRPPVLSAHRGGSQPGFPENCIATFEHSLRHTCTMLEVDPRLTRDGMIVLHHDVTLDRTTSGTGRLGEQSWNQLGQLTLSDSAGQPTDYHIPTLDAAIEWAREKTVLVLDQKDVPLEQRIAAISENRAEGFVMLIIGSVQDAIAVHRSNPQIAMEIMVPDMRRVRAIDDAGVPWDRLIAFVGHQWPTDRNLIEAIHQRGACCMAGTSRHLDKQLATRGPADPELRQRYRDLVDFGIDMIETDLPIQVSQVLKR